MEEQQPIRILQVVTNMSYGGLENFIMNNYRHVDRERVQFDFLTHFAEHQDYEEEIERLGGKIYRLPKLNPFDKKYLKGLDTFFAEHPEYKVVHSHLNCFSGIILKAAKANGIPVRLAHAHTALTKSLNPEYIAKSTLKRLIPLYATDMFACGEKAGDFVFGHSPYTIIKNSIDTPNYLYSPETSVAVKKTLGFENCFVLGHVGMFRPEKNHIFLLNLIKSLSQSDSSVRLLSIGNGPMFEEIKAKAEQMGVADKIVFTGGRNDVNKLLQAMDVFLLPSLFEGFPVTMVEAQAAGLPCVTSDTVPAECDLTGDVKRISLTAPLDQWEDAVFSSKNSLRRNNSENIIKAGFDIKANAKWLEDFYVSKYNGQ